MHTTACCMSGRTLMQNADGFCRLPVNSTVARRQGQNHTRIPTLCCCSWCAAWGRPSAPTPVERGALRRTPTLMGPAPLMRQHGSSCSCMPRLQMVGAASIMALSTAANGRSSGGSSMVVIYISIVTTIAGSRTRRSAQCSEHSLCPHQL